MAAKRLNLALQGGGAHGAFTWGVLDRLLEEPDLEVAAITGTSAGALNAAVFKAGFAKGGAEGARAQLSWLWEQIGAVSDPTLSQWLDWSAPAAPLLAKALEYSPIFAGLDYLSRISSPYGFSSLTTHPLETLVEKIDFDLVCAQPGPELHLCATNVRSGKIRVFTGDEIGPEAILASACLPTLFKAVEIEDPKTGRLEAYWDGGYTGNPALFPLFREDLPADVLIVNINPLHRDEVPRVPQAIHNRINEISFNSSLLRELRAIHFVQRLIASGQVAEGQMKRVLVHMISDDILMNSLNVATKLIPTPVVLARLKESGRQAAASFLENEWHKVGQQSSVDLVEMFG